MSVSQILPRLFVGSCPTSTQAISELRSSFGITAILNLQTDDDLDSMSLQYGRLEAYSAEQGITVRRIPVDDFAQESSRPLLHECVAFLEELLDDGHTVLVHCSVGTARSPTVVAAYLHWRQGWSLEAAIEYLMRCRPCSPSVEAIALATVSRTAA